MIDNCHFTMTAICEAAISKTTVPAWKLPSSQELNKPSEILRVKPLNLTIKVTFIDNLPDCTFFVSRFIYFAMENHSLPLSPCPDLLT